MAKIGIKNRVYRRVKNKFQNLSSNQNEIKWTKQIDYKYIKTRLKLKKNKSFKPMSIVIIWISIAEKWANKSYYWNP